MQEKKIKYGSRNVKTAPTQQTDMHGLPNYLPVKPRSEDNESTKRHITWLQDAYKSRSRADNNKVMKLMTLTLYQRRQEITNGEDIKMFLDKYPWLHIADQVVEEFHRISDLNVNENFDTFINENKFALISMAQIVKNQSELFNLLRGAEGDYATNCMIILGVILMMNEEVTHLIGNEVPEPGVTPVFIKCDVSKFLDEGAFEVFIDGVHVCTATDFVEAFKLYICTYYIFNIAYGTLKKTLTFFDCMMLRLKQEQKSVHKCVIKVIAKLNALKEKQRQTSNSRKGRKKSTK